MLNKRLFAAAALAGSCLAAAGAQAADGIKVGVLSCNVSSGWGVVFGSTREINCAFQPAKGSMERYAGHISKYGVDIGYTQGGVIVWAVFAPTSSLAAGALAGNYVGATAGATVGVGAGAHALLGGFNKSVSLQPVSIEGNAGLNVAAGIGELTLRSQN